MTAHAHQYLIEPAAPLVFGTGRPLDFGLGGETLPFPFPSSLAGTLRAAVSAKAGLRPDPYADREEVTVGAAALARLDRCLGLQTLLFARPADAVYIGGELQALRPVERASSSWCNLPKGLRPLALQTTIEAKPDKAPAWWTAAEMQAWLAGRTKPVAADFSGDAGPVDASRMHVVIESQGGRGAVQGGLFRTTGRDFGPVRGHGGYAIWLSTGNDGLDLLPRRVGGEGRLARFRRLPATARVEWPAMPVAMSGGDLFRFVLVTPALFETGGWRPDWLDAATLEGEVPTTGVRVRIEAAAITRAQNYSGWQPSGPARAWRVVPAGTVYWLRIVEGDPSALHGATLCLGQWQRDGWGRGLLGKA